jgi:hypothetical protein
MKLNLDLIFVCGGLGPTPDDKTAEAIAKCFDLKLVENKAVSDDIFITESTYWTAHSFTFYQSVGAGTHTVTIQWRVYENTTTGQVDERTLTVIALPA